MHLISEFVRRLLLVLLIPQLLRILSTRGKTIRLVSRLDLSSFLLPLIGASWRLAADVPPLVVSEVR